MSLKGFDGVFFGGVDFEESLTVVEIDEIGRSVVLSALAAFRAVSGEMSYFSALEAGVRRVSCGSRVALEVVLWAVSLISIRVLPSTEVIPLVVSSVVSSGWCPVSIYVHWDWGVIHPAGSVG